MLTKWKPYNISFDIDRTDAFINNKKKEKHAGNIFMHDKVLKSRIYFIYICIPLKNDLNHILSVSEIGC